MGLRPTWGLVSRYGVLPVCWSMDTVGPVSRTVEDCAITFQVIAGYDPKDSYTRNQPLPDYRKELTGDIQGLRVGVISDKVYGDDVDREISDAVATAAGALGELGASVEQVSMPLLEAGGTVSKCLTDLYGATVHHQWLKTRAEEYDYNSRVRLLTAILTPAQAFYKAQKLRTLIRTQVLKQLEDVDVLVLPTSPVVAPKIIDAPGIKSQADANSRMSGVRSWTGAFNLANVPAISVPCGFTSANLPISLQIAGRPFEDATIMNVAHAYERSTAWHTRRPPL